MASDIRFGIMARGQYPAGDDVRARFDELIEQAKLAARLGYDCLAKSSHYSTYPMQEFQQIPLLARLSAETPELRLCAGVVLLALHKPLDVAERAYVSVAELSNCLDQQWLLRVFLNLAADV